MSNKNKRFNEALQALPNYYNDIIDHLLILFVKKNVPLEDVYNCLGITRQALDMRFQRMPKELKEEMEAIK